jgi:hypothetical protein
MVGSGDRSGTDPQVDEWHTTRQLHTDEDTRFARDVTDKQSCNHQGNL